MSTKISNGAARHEVWQHIIEAQDADTAEDALLDELLGKDTGPDSEYGEAWSILSVEEIDSEEYAVTVVHFWRTTEDPS